MKTMIRLVAACVMLFAWASAASATNTLEITEFSAIGVPSNGGQAQAATLPHGGDNTQTVDFTSAPTSSNALKSSTTYVRLHCGKDNTSSCALQWGTSPSNATGTNMTLGVDKEEYFFLDPNDVGTGIKFNATAATH